MSSSNVLNRFDQRLPFPSCHNCPGSQLCLYFQSGDQFDVLPTYSCWCHVTKWYITWDLLFELGFICTVSPCFTLSFRPFLNAFWKNIAERCFLNWRGFWTLPSRCSHLFFFNLLKSTGKTKNPIVDEPIVEQQKHGKKQQVLEKASVAALENGQADVTIGPRCSKLLRMIMAYNIMPQTWDIYTWVYHHIPSMSWFFHRKVVVCPTVRRQKKRPTATATAFEGS